jgi:hypothetical protein
MLQTRESVATERAAWEAQHPKFCRHCGGHGGFYSSFDPSPAGVSLAPGSMTDYDACSECVEKGICPVCGHTTLNDEGASCASCGWNYDEGDENAAVPPMTVEEWDRIEDERLFEDELAREWEEWRQLERERQALEWDEMRRQNECRTEDMVLVPGGQGDDTLPPY